MLKKVLFAVSLLVLAACSRDVDLYEEPVNPNSTTAEDIKSHFESIFGFPFNPNQDWSMINSGELAIKANSSVKKVQILVDLDVTSENSESWETPNEMRVLNEKVLNGQTSFSMKYDAPKVNRGLYVAFTTDEGFVLRKVEGNSVSIDDPASSRMTRAAIKYPLPTRKFAIDSIYESYGSQRGYLATGVTEYLYDLDSLDYLELKMTAGIPDYSTDFKQMFREYVFSTFPNGKDKNGKMYDNLPKVKASGILNSSAYPVTTEGKPVVVTPVYKCDHPTQYGHEVWSSDLYYYYYKDGETYVAPDDTVKFLQSLPKFKAVKFNMAYELAEDDVISKKGSFVLLYYGDKKVLEKGDLGSVEFPAGYKIGFMIRAQTPAEGGKKQGEIYGDGRLNNGINHDQKRNFKTSNFGDDAPRVAWINFNGRLLMCWESGTDRDFNDIILDVDGVKGPNPPYNPTYNSYTLCYEDTELGDYDLNDIVIYMTRKDETTVEYSLQACGAWDSLFVENINVAPIYGHEKPNATEIHYLFGKTTTKTFINTEKNGEKCTPITVTKTVDKSFTFAEIDKLPYIYDATTGNTVYLATKGDGPHAVMIPEKFMYPLEKIPVHKAYARFPKWASEDGGNEYITSTNWYEEPFKGLVYTW